MLGFKCLSSGEFFKIKVFETFFQVYHQCQTDWIQIVLAGLIWVRTVCKVLFQCFKVAGNNKARTFLLVNLRDFFLD